MKDLRDKLDKLNIAYRDKMQKIKDKYPDMKPSMLTCLMQEKTLWHRKRIDTLLRKLFINQ
jgi:hypothetical protein